MASWLDVAILIIYLVCTALVGFYPTFWQPTRSRERTDADAYFLAGRRANCAVVAISLLSGMTSGIGMIGFPASAYDTGAGIAFAAVGYAIGGTVVAAVITPVFTGLKLTTAYTYVEMRFSRKLRTMMSVAFLCRVVSYLAIVLVAPADLLSMVFGMPPWVSIVSLGSLATVYTVHGGMQSVILTDFVQSLTLVFGLLAVIAYALLGSQGSLSKEDWRIDSSGLHSFSIFKASVWGYIIGASFTYAAQMGTDQIVIQRLISTPSLVAAQKSAFATGCLQVCGVVPQALAGVAIHAFYRLRDVDPLSGGDTVDSILPYFLTHETPAGIPGAFAGAVSGCTLSVFAGGLNASAACVVIDLLQNARGRLLTNDDEILRYSRKATLALGVTSIALGLLANVFGKGLVQVTNVSFGLTAGPIFGVFMLGILTERSCSQAAWIAVAFGLAAAGILGFLAFGCHSNEGICALQINSWLTTPVISLVTFFAGLLASHVLRSPPSSSLEGLTVWSVAPSRSAVDCAVPLARSAQLSM